MINDAAQDYANFTQSELNFYRLLKAALLLDCEHILEWDCLQLFGHASVLRLNKAQQRELYFKSRQAILCELQRKNDTAILKAVLT